MVESKIPRTAAIPQQLAMLPGGMGGGWMDEEEGRRRRGGGGGGGDWSRFIGLKCGSHQLSIGARVNVSAGNGH